MFIKVATKLSNSMYILRLNCSRFYDIKMFFTIKDFSLKPCAITYFSLEVTYLGRLCLVKKGLFTHRCFKILILIFHFLQKVWSLYKKLSLPFYVISSTLRSRVLL